MTRETPPLSGPELDLLFNQARSFSYWQERTIPDELLKRLYELLKWGPTAANSTPARFLFIKSEEAKARLKPCLDAGNVEKSMSAPVVTVIAMDLEFYERLPFLFPHTDARVWFAGKPEKILASANLNTALQGAYLILAARSLGLDCGPMSGFDNAALDAQFFPDGKVKSLFLCALGYGDRSKLYPRGPRLAFDEACEVL
jgi:3-hydroxypropanoate dehydrogenase